MLPGQTENNPKYNVSGISLRSGKSYEGPSEFEPKDEAEKETEEVFGKKDVEEKVEKGTPKQTKSVLKEYKSMIPFPSRLRSRKCKREDEEIMDTFRNF